LRDGTLPGRAAAAGRARSSSSRGLPSGKRRAGIDRSGPVKRGGSPPQRGNDMSLEPLKERIGAINDLLTTVNLLVWDSRTMMPSGAAAARGRQVATLTRLARDFACDDDMMRRLEAAERAVAVAGADELDRAAVRQVRDAVDAHRRIPAGLGERRARLQASATQAWIDARARDDFASFEPLLAETMVLARALADALGWSEHPYDALVGLYRPGGTLA